MPTKKAPAKKAVVSAAVAEPTTSIKGFNSDWTCRGFRFEIGKTYSVDGPIVVCENGFHACPINEHPFSVFEYYHPSGSRFAEVTQSGESKRLGNKLASASLTIGLEVSIGDLVARAVEWVFARSIAEGKSATGDYGAASATGEQGAASATGDYGAASATGKRGAASATGFYGAASATGERGAASATGFYGAASATGERGAAGATGFHGAASATGEQGAASATGDYGAASATGERGAAGATGFHGAASATGDYGAASATGKQGAASATGNYGAASAMGKNSSAFAPGGGGRVKGALGATLHADERDPTGKALSTASGIVGKNGIKENTWYAACDGELVEVAS